MAIGLVLAATPAVVAPAVAQVIPDNALPDRIGRELEQRDDALDRDDPEIQLPGDDRPFSDGDDTSLVLDGIEITGLTVIDPATLESLYADRLGTEVTLADLHAIADAITDAMRARGYLISRAVLPAQRVRGGRVSIEVLEGYIADVEIQSDAVADDDHRVRRFADRIMASRPLHVADLERYLLLLEDLPGISVRSVLTPSPAAAGASTLVLRIEKQGLTAAVRADNRGTTYVGPVQVGASLGVNGVAGDHDRLRARYIRSADLEELEFMEVSYRRPLDSDGTLFDAHALLSRSEPGDRVDALDIKGRNLTLAAGLRHALIRSRTENLFLSGRFVLRNTESRLYAGTPTEERLAEDRLRVLTAALSYDRTDDWDGVTLVDVTLSQGVEILRPRVTGSPGLSRANGKTDFTKVRLEVRRLQEILPDLVMLVGARGQYSFDSLLASEAFGYGGVDYGRAYDPSEITGDIGVAAKAELRYDLPLPDSLFGWDGLDAVLPRLQAFGYYDIGRTWVRDPINGESDSETGASTGGGLRLTLFDRLDATVEVGVPLTRPVATQDHGNRPRFFFSLVFAY